MKTCLDCRAAKDPVTGFYRNKRKADGFDIYCRECTRRRHAVSRAKRTPDQIAKNRQTCLAWQRANPEKVAAHNAKWANANREKKRRADKVSYERYRDRYLEGDRLRRLANYDAYRAREKLREEARKPEKAAQVKLWRAANPHVVVRQAADRRAAKALRKPAWVSEADIKKMEDIYECARLLTELTGVPHHVDHVVPLRGRLVSGLHVPNNLEILTAEENLKKSNLWSIE